MQACVYEFLKNKNDCEVLIASNDKQSQSIGDLVSFLGLKPFILPDFRASFGDDLRSFSEEFSLLLATLNLYESEQNPKKILISPIKTIIHDLPNAKLLKTLHLEFGQNLDLKKLKQKLLFWGYEFVDVVEEKGEVSFRGDIIDIFSPDFINPVRISLFDDEIESIREFSCEDQKSSKDELEKIKILPALFSLNEDEYEQMNQKLSQIKTDSFIQDMVSLGFWTLSSAQSQNFLKIKKCYILPDAKALIGELKEFEDNPNKELLDLVPQIPEEKEYKNIITSNIPEFLSFHKDKKINILAKNEALVKALDLDKDLKIYYKKSPFVVNIMGKNEIIISLNKPQKKQRRRKKASIVLDELKINDYIVHESYGIGIFKGLKKTMVLGVTKDFVEIAYQGDDKLLLPVENLDVIDRYVSESGTLAVVDRLGRGSFLRLKQKVKAKLFEIAEQIVKMAAKRELMEAKPIDSHERELNDFRLNSGFIYTKDQEKAVEDILNDLKSGNVMDRLLSADVGFGKTEVAMNAILACVKSGYQALFLAPTTLLSSQHFKSLKIRFDGFDIRVNKIDRFVSSKDKKSIFSLFEDGKIDVLVGTHALLGIKAKNLALLVIDEEHKFGVKQKEKLKQLSENMHLLSMSATPIPRSLNMALSSIKGYSQILTPPSEREDVRTFVKEYDESLLKEIIMRELRRGGQIFYVHNRIASIEQKAKELRQIYPKLRILVLHSKVSPAISEKEMINFESGEYDMLLSTSIIESGIHLPNVNTMIVDNSDRFGMADLHQLRGRVGRGSRQGYCYLLVDDKQVLSDSAKKRLIALEANSFLGSGSVLAYHDLEIRGGGNLVGEAQSGHIKNIGYSLYLKMLEDAINTLLNNKSVKRNDIDLKLSVNAYLSDILIAEDRVRLELYRRLSKCENVNEVYEIEGEIEDRFGKLDSHTLGFLQVIIIKILAQKTNTISITNYGQNISISSGDGKKITLKSKSKDDDDILATLLEYFRKEVK
ncbi:MAG: transcription-repair coupling factor [Proteobacteria bacterium]|nr:MAG: transcription-repair coupling factor [Pseudomonadota bacterium]